VIKDFNEYHFYPNGQPAYKERFDSVVSFYEGLAQVRKNGDRYQICPNGTRV